MAATNVQAFPGDVTISSNLAVDTNTLFVDSVGNKVGIGTTAPANKLYIYDNDTTTSQITLKQASQDGRVGVNMVSSNDQGFFIQKLGGTTATSNVGIIENFSTVNGGIDFFSKGDGNYTFSTTDSNSQRMNITNAGLVGIGTNTPTGQLEVHGDGQTSETTFNQAGLMGGVLALRSDDGSTGSGGAVMFGTNAGFHAAIKASLEDGSTNTRGRLAFFTRTNTGDATMSHAMTIADGGSVGIGTTSPNSLLHVDGDVRMKTLSTDVIGKVTAVYARGTGSNNNTNRLVKIGDATVVNTTTRGLTLTIINASTHAHVSSTNYDTHGSDTASNSLATALEAMTDAQIGILTSHDAYEDNMTANLIAAAFKLGLTRLAGSADDLNRHPYSAIFYGPGAAANPGNQVLEVMKSDAASGAYATLSTFLVDDSFIGQAVTNALYSGTADSTTPSVFVDRYAKVGIGTTAPADRLHVYGDNIRITQTEDTNGFLKLYRKDTSGGPSVVFYNADDSAQGWFGFGSSSTNDIRMVSATADSHVSFWTNDTRRMTISASTGNVAIGATTNTHKFYVNGTVRTANLGVNTDAPTTSGFASIHSNYPAAHFEATHSLGLVSVVTAAPVNGAGYNSTGSYGNNAVFRADVDSTADSGWKFFSGVTAGTQTFSVKRSGVVTCVGLTIGGFDLSLGSGDQSTRGDSGNSRALVKLAGAVLNINYANDFSGGVSITGAVSKGSGSFKIDHPLPEMTDTHSLIHSFIEGPQADNLYRGTVQLGGGTAQVNLDEASKMTEGTFVVLNRKTQCFTSNESGWDQVKGELSGNVLTIECENPTSNANVSWLVIGERHDKHMFDTEWTDKNGSVITEPLKEMFYDEDKFAYYMNE